MQISVAFYSFFSENSKNMYFQYEILKANKTTNVKWLTNDDNNKAILFETILSVTLFGNI